MRLHHSAGLPAYPHTPPFAYIPAPALSHPLPCTVFSCLRFSPPSHSPALAPTPRQQDYAALTSMLLIEGASEDERVARLLEAIARVQAQVGLPVTLRDVIGAAREGEFMVRLPGLGWWWDGGGRHVGMAFRLRQAVSGLGH
jgi:hypothetical protein